MALRYALALAALAIALGLVLGKCILQPVAVHYHVAVASLHVPVTVVPLGPLLGTAPSPAATPGEPEVSGAAGGPLRDRIGFVGLRTRLRAELDRRAGLPADDPQAITADDAAKARELVGKLGDGHLLDLIVKYGPALIKLAEAILALIAVI